MHDTVFMHKTLDHTDLRNGEPLAKRLRTIVVIDDNIDLTLTVQMFLSRFGHTVYGAETGRDGMALLAELVPDVVFSDIDLPDRDGFELAALIKSEPTLRHIPLFAVTARGDLRSMPAADQFDRLLIKPVPLETMLAIVESLPVGEGP